MKKFYVFIILCIVTFGLTAAFIAHIRHSNKESLTQQEAQWNQEKEQILAELDALNVRMGELKASYAPEKDNPELEPKALIARLREMKDWFEVFKPISVQTFMEPNPTEIGKVLEIKTLLHDQIEEAFFIFRELQNQGDKSLDAIHDYLASKHNVNLYNRIYQTYREEKKHYLYLLKKIKDQFSPVPETSRLGIIYALGNIKTPKALELLYQTMQSTTDFKEITSAGSLLLAADKKAFIQPVLSIYKAIFSNCSLNEQNILLMRIKEASEKDFKELLQSLPLYNDKGELSIDMFCLKTANMGEEGIPEAYKAFNRSNATLQEKINILNFVKQFIGSNDQVNSMFINLMNNMEGNDKDFVGATIIMGISRTRQEKEKQQQYLNLLNQLPVKQDDPSIFAEYLRLTKEKLTLSIEQNENSTIIPSYDYQNKYNQSMYDFGNQHHLSIPMLMEFCFNNPW